MGIGDPTHAQCNVTWPNDPRLQKLSSDGKWMNHCMWLKAVECRCTVLPRYYDRVAIGKLAGVRKDRMDKQWQLMTDMEMIEIMPDGRVKVLGARRYHSRLRGWRFDSEGIYDSETPGKEKEKEKEKENLKESAQVTTPDPFFQTNKTISLPDENIPPGIEEMTELVNWAMAHYKINDNGVAVQTQVHHLTGGGATYSEIMAAMQAKIVLEPREKFRPKFANAFPNAAEVKRLASGDWKKAQADAEIDF